MLLTPTYHVFDLYQSHHGATLLPTRVVAPDYALDAVKVPSLSVSASRDKDGRMTISLVNLDPGRAANVSIDTGNKDVRAATGRVITAPSMDARPEFGQPDPLAPSGLGRITVRAGVASFVAPAKSVVVLKLH